MIAKIQNAMQEALSRIQKKLTQPEAKQTGTKQIKEKARPSVLAKLRRNQEEAAQRDTGRQKAGKKQNIER